jgi:hypothetical protein
VSDRVEDDLRRGAVLWDLHAATPYRLDVYTASIRDGRGNTLHKQLIVVRADQDGSLTLRQPTLFLDLIPAARGARPPSLPLLPGRAAVEVHLVEHALKPFLAEVTEQRTKENRVVREHIEISLNELINRQQIALAELLNRRVGGENVSGLEGNIAQAENHLDELNGRLEQRCHELEKERHCTIGDMQHLGRAWSLPHPERNAPGIAPMISDPEIEKIAIRVVMEHERSRGWVVESVENENRGYDLLSKRPHPSEPGVFIQARFIEVKGRAGTGEVALTSNEYRTAQRLADDFWLYVVFECGTTPALKAIQDPARLGWEPVVQIEHYHVSAKAILEAACG